MIIAWEGKQLSGSRSRSPAAAGSSERLDCATIPAVATLLTGGLLQLAVGRAIAGVFLPIGLALVLAAAGVALKLNLRDSSKKVRVPVGVLGGLLVLLGVWGLATKPSLMITGVTPYPQQKVLRNGEPCPASIDVIAVVRATGGPESVRLQLRSPGGRTVPVITPKFQYSEKESRQAFGPYQVALPRKPRPDVPLELHTTSPMKVSNTAVVRNDGCVPRS